MIFTTRINAYVIIFLEGHVAEQISESYVCFRELLNLLMASSRCLSLTLQVVELHQNRNRKWCHFDKPVYRVIKQNGHDHSLGQVYKADKPNTAEEFNPAGRSSTENHYKSNIHCICMAYWLVNCFFA